MNVLVTGALGNVGTSALHALLEKGHRVRCFDLRTPANEAAARRFGAQVEVVWGDLRRPADVAAAVEGQDVVVHLAFIIPKLSATGVESEAAPDWAREINVGGTSNLLQAMAAQPRPPRIIFSSSLHVFGQTHDQPPPRRVTDPVQPIEHYAHHKVECENMIRSSGLEWAILRFGAVLPLAMKLDPGMFDVPLDNRMEFVHTRDVGLAIANAVDNEQVWGKILLIGGGPHCQYYYRDMVRQIMDGMGVGMLPEEAFGKVPFCTDWLDTAESQQILQYQRRTLDDYVQDMQKVLGFRLQLIRLFRPLVRQQLLIKSPVLRELRSKRAGVDWKGKVAVVTGASSGIGAETARRLAQEGLRIVLVARRAERMESLAEELRQAGGETLVIAADLSEERERVRVFEQVHAAYGAVDVLVNSAGLGWYGSGADMPWTLALQMMQINMAAAVHMTLLFLQDMRDRNSGHIINVGSVIGGLPSQGAALYGATKSFLDSFTTALYRELRGTNVHISVVRPGAVDTEFYDVAAAQSDNVRIPAERLAIRPTAVAERIWGLLRRPRRVIYVPTVLAFVPWVEMLFGWIIDRIGAPLLRHQLRLARRSAQ